MTMKKKLGGKNLAIKDPLMKKGHVKVANNQVKKVHEPVNAADRILQLTLLTVIPLTIYSAILMLWLFEYYERPVWTASMSAIVFGCCVVQYISAQAFVRREKNMWKKWVG